jgi:transglutaminase-like putative cysteine protease
VCHRTTYKYANEVGYARCHLRLTPRSSTLQTLLKASLAISPAPADRHDHLDMFDNVLTTVVIEAPHRQLVVEAQCLVDVRSPTPIAAHESEAWEAARTAGLASLSLAPASPSLYAYPTRSTPLVPAITEFALASFTPQRPILEASADLLGRLKAHFVYDPDATEVNTHIQEAFGKRRGVCQDFAHVMISGLRGIGLTARYVSGYILTVPAPGQPRLEGADASHAWIELWCGPDLGWVGMDPTNNMFAGEEHIVLACGRDYGDVAPISGILLGSGRQTLKVEVDVEKQGETPADNVIDLALSRA